MKRTKKKNEKKQKMVNKEVETEDWCFLCKDGGQLMFCDYGSIILIVWEKMNLFQKLESSGLVIRSDNGLCHECLELVILGEENEAFDINGEKIDFEDRDSFEGLFKEYWEIVKEKEGFTMDDVYAANTQLKKKKNKKRKSLSFKIGKEHQEDEFIILDSDKEETEPCKPLGKKKRSMKQGFIGWGSKPLIEFLKSIGKDTTERLPHYEVDSVIKGYIREKNLVDQERKYKVNCDEKLYSVFRKRSLTKSRIFHLLEAHLVESMEESEEDVDDGDGDQVRCPKKDENDNAACNKRRTLSSDMENQENEVETIIKQNSFASIVAENIKLVYLRRSLVEELCKQPESFEGKVVGSFLRIKTDPKDFLQRNSHQLLPVTGVDKSSAGEILLRVSLMPQGLYIHMLSDSDFTKEECEDLQEKIESGVLNKIPVVELEKRARTVHEDITKHWIERELVLLQNRIDCANEKGRRREYPFTILAIWIQNLKLVINICQVITLVKRTLELAS
ncbi:Uncharacterized protein L484_023425 [Morus notabilis]|uniref:Uncharacterized protein n=1 Tax=Morus notabilis TaxID=981085 RepID=W9RDB0_9ROSA|nr:Uncharacterized protein L484_023425 [Morus notabilis]